MSNKHNDNFWESLKEEVEEKGYIVKTKEDILKALKDVQSDYEYTAQLRHKETGEVLARISSHSLEGLEMEFSKLEHEREKQEKIAEQEHDEFYHHKYKDIEYDAKH